jgi:photosynthetic reaction center cytochrome c subunit
MKLHNPKLTLLAAAITAVVISGCERPPVDSVQRGYRGTGMEVVLNPRIEAEKAAANQAPAPQPAVSSAGPKAGDIYQNVQVLGDLSIGEFTRLMAAITEWVSPEQGCNYCHEGNNFAEDKLYTKKVSRTMLAMTQRVNDNWKTHVADTGVTCYTCHRGENVPANVWVRHPGVDNHAGMLSQAQQNVAGEAAPVYASLPYDPFTPFLEGDYQIGVISDTALPAGSRISTKQTEWTYSLMMHFSDSLGTNCTYCHNSRGFAQWDEGSPQKVTAWHGIRMVRELNNSYIWPTNDWLPAHRQGPLGDPQKINCNTCHNGVYKPLYGAPMLKDYPNLATQSAAVEAMFHSEERTGE